MMRGKKKTEKENTDPDHVYAQAYQSEDKAATSCEADMPVYAEVNKKKEIKGEAAATDPPPQRSDADISQLYYYAQVNKKKKKKKKDDGTDTPVDQLYAQVDKKKKAKNGGILDQSPEHDTPVDHCQL